MKIGVITNSIYQDQGARRVNLLIKELLKRKHEVYVFTNSKAKEISEGFKGSIKIKRVPASSLFFPFFMLIKSGKILKKLDYVISICPSYSNSIPLIFLKNPKKHLDLIDPPFINCEMGEGGWMKDYFSYLCAIVSFKRGEVLTATTKNILNVFDKKGGKSKVILNGADITEFKPFSEREKIRTKKSLGFAKTDRLIGFFGGMKLDKSPFEMREFILKNIKKYKFLIVGRGRYEYIFKNLAKEYPERILFLGYLNPREIPRLMAICEKTISFLLNKKWLKKCVPAKTYESVACGVPVICNLREGEYYDLIKKYCWDTKKGCVLNRNHADGLKYIKELVSVIENNGKIN